MPLNNTVAKINRQADEDFREKLRLERRMNTELKSLFKEMSRDMEIAVFETGSAQSAGLYLDDLKGIHSQQARRVTNAFSGVILDFLEENQDNLNERVIRDLTKISQVLNIDLPNLIQSIRGQTRIKLREFNAVQVARDSALITTTNQREMDAAVEKVRAENPDFTSQQIATASSREFLSRSRSRAETISATFTQKIAENTKDTEKNSFFAVRNGVASLEAGVPQVDEEKVWVTRGDNVVRPAHLSADFTMSEGDIFTVDSESLRFPGDTSLGATAKNVINCRCSSVVTIE